REYREIDDACVEAQQFAGPGRRIRMVTFILPTGCYFMPGGAMALWSTGFGVRDWHTLVFETPDRIRETLQQLRANYLYVDTSPEAILLSCDAHSALFQSDNIKKYLRVVWQKGPHYLLTWRKEPSAESPRDREFRERWLQMRGRLNIAPLCARIQEYYRAQHGKFPVRADPTLPKLPGWQ
ncbi:MAG: hypothetical protein WC712_13420, partial [Candidatus Brocadiia bacterium]